MTLLNQLQDDLEQRLLSCPEFRHVPVLRLEGTSDRAAEEIRGELQRIVSCITLTEGKGGLAVLIQLPRVRLEDGMMNVPGPQVQLACRVQIIESRAMNRDHLDGTGIPAPEMAHTVLSLLHLFQPRPGVCLLADENAIDPVEVDDDLGADLALEVNVWAPIATQPAAKVPAPTLSVQEGSLVLIGAEGAEHWFSLDGRYPRPATEWSYLYAAPVPVAAGTVVRAASYHAAFCGSDVMELTV